MSTSCSATPFLTKCGLFTLSLHSSDAPMPRTASCTSTQLEAGQQGHGTVLKNRQLLQATDITEVSPSTECETETLQPLFRTCRCKSQARFPAGLSAKSSGEPQTQSASSQPCSWTPSQHGCEGSAASIGLLAVHEGLSGLEGLKPCLLQVDHGP